MEKEDEITRASVAYTFKAELPTNRGEGGGGDTEPPGGLGGDLAGWDS